AACPTIISRAQWGARIPRCQSGVAAPMKYAIIHHTAWQCCTTLESCIQQMKHIQNYHMDNKGWCDIGYSFLIGEDGNVYEGRGWNTEGAHTSNYNTTGYGISFMGNFTNVAPNAAALAAVKNLLCCAVSKGYLRPDYVLKGHRDLGTTECPGSSFYNLIKKWPRFHA
uniref:Peptidoglycan recognition protein 1 n=2 Tax=Latimeria chalumnae TaxID=7897 RepID=H3ACA9_LATCH